MNDSEEILRYNRQAWDRQVERGNRWTQPVGPEAIARARNGATYIATRALKPRP